MQVIVVYDLSKKIGSMVTIEMVVGWVGSRLPSKQLLFVLQFIIPDLFYRSTTILGPKSQKGAEKEDHSCNCVSNILSGGKVIKHTLDGGEFEVGP